MSLRHAILGLLSIRPMSGYDLKKTIDESVGHFWTADQSQIYRTLTGLVDEGMASRETVVQSGRPNQHVHGATELGLAELDRWLASPMEPQPTREPFLARLFFADRMPAHEIRKLLHARRHDVTLQLAALEMIAVPAAVPENVTETEFVLRMATLANGIAHARAELDWLESTERQLGELAS
ncbi:PadR family transcriptional regulator [Agromyces laixinhei]|uniref:PadR family transcriptional regulator n=1 Tax=Agromyces laixinhei TaxID=2585717 RepID=UPI0012EE7617|nr:PadR family transcriptional regulator [Agromyces laixinhei]